MLIKYNAWNKDRYKWNWNIMKKIMNSKSIASCHAFKGSILAHFLIFDNWSLGVALGYSKWLMVSPFWLGMAIIEPLIMQFNK